ncbi:MAG: DUF58 domain-containing protein [Spirochaetaceae bacterium]|nr:MAG: DUF58 domain-containing protein [Spirochaetaceae bacterium]
MITIDKECEAVSRLFAKKSVRLKVPVGVKSENPIFRRKGSSFNLKSLREYQPFDDLRQIDWKLYGRTDRYYIKEFYEEENERFFLLVDSSASIPIFGTEYYLSFIASLAFIFLRLHFNLNMVSFTHKLEASCLNIKEHRAIPRALGFLEHLEFSGSTNLVQVLQTLRELYQPTTLFLFSDLFDRQLTLQHLRGFRRVFLLHFFTPFSSFSLRHSEIEVEDRETRQRLLLPNNPVARREIHTLEQRFLGRFDRPRRGYHYLQIETTMERVPFYWRILEALYD